ncbi:MAG TPA: hypothetical protein VJ747_19220, partial [Stellaceae bacterium]|nr:hypothetical protein [Stellaceae bacterium]
STISSAGRSATGSGFATSRSRASPAATAATPSRPGATGISSPAPARAGRVGISSSSSPAPPLSHVPLLLDCPIGDTAAAAMMIGDVSCAP